MYKKCANRIFSLLIFVIVSFAGNVFSSEPDDSTIKGATCLPEYRQASYNSVKDSTLTLINAVKKVASALAVANIEHCYGVKVISDGGAQLSLNQLKILSDVLAQYGPQLLGDLKTIHITPDAAVGFRCEYNPDSMTMSIEGDPTVTDAVFRNTVVHELAHEVDLSANNLDSFKNLYYQSTTSQDFAGDYGKNNWKEDFAVFVENFFADPTATLSNAINQGPDSIFCQKLALMIDILSKGHPETLTITSSDQQQSITVSVQRDGNGKVTGINGVSFSDKNSALQMVSNLETSLYPNGKPPPPDMGGLVQPFRPADWPQSQWNIPVIQNTIKEVIGGSNGDVAKIFGIDESQAPGLQIKVDNNLVSNGDYFKVQMRDPNTGIEKTFWVNVAEKFIVTEDQAKVFDFSTDITKELTNKAHSILGANKDTVNNLLGVTGPSADSVKLKLDYSDFSINGNKIGVTAQFTDANGNTQEKMLFVDLATRAISLE